MMRSNSCPVGSLQSFPVGISFPLKKESYRDAKNHPLNIKFNWGTRTSTPKFSYAGSGEIDHIVNDNGTYITYNNIRFNLASVQLTSPTHNPWLLPATLETTKLDNMEDIIMTYQLDTFNTNGDNDPKFIILVNPIMRIITPITNPTYLTNLANGVSSPVTLEGLFPYESGKNYAYYTTCIAGNTLNQPYRNILVILNTQGSLVSNNLMKKIKENYNKFSQGNYPNYIPLANFSVSPSIVSRVSTLEGFATTAAVTTPSETSTKPSTGTVTAYNTVKCVPFDPEKNLTKNGTIVIDTKTGLPFTYNTNASIEEKRNVIGALTNTDGSLQYPDVAIMLDDDISKAYLNTFSLFSERTAKKSTFLNGITGTIPYSSVETAAVSVIALIGIIIIILLFYNFLNSVRGTSVDWVWILKFLNFAFLNIGLFIGGFIAGMYLIPANCPTTTTNSSGSSGSSGS